MDSFFIVRFLCVRLFCEVKMNINTKKIYKNKETEEKNIHKINQFN